MTEKTPKGLTGKATEEAAPKDWQNILPNGLPEKTGKEAAGKPDGKDCCR